MKFSPNELRLLGRLNCAGLIKWRKVSKKTSLESSAPCSHPSGLHLSPCDEIGATHLDDPNLAFDIEDYVRVLAVGHHGGLYTTVINFQRNWNC